MSLWTPADDDRLRAALGECRSEAELASRMGRSYDAIAHHCLHLGWGRPGQYLAANRKHDTQPAPAPPPMRGAPVNDLDYDEDTIGDGGPALVADPVPVADRTYVEKPANDSAPVLDRGELERVLLVPDCHFPFADRRAWDVMIRAAKRLRPHRIVILGDFADVFSASSHDRDPRRFTQLEDELKATRAAKEELEDLGAQENVFVEGNHEWRLTRYLMQHAPALLSSVRIQDMLGLERWRFVPYMSHSRIGKLYLCHDVGHAGVHAAQLTGAAFESNVVFGHTHRLQCVYTGSVRGERHVSCSLGWLGDASEAKYLPEAKKRGWQLAFGVAYIEQGSGNVHLQPIPIVDYRAVMGGEMVRAA